MNNINFHKSLYAETGKLEGWNMSVYKTGPKSYTGLLISICNGKEATIDFYVTHRLSVNQSDLKSDWLIFSFVLQYDASGRLSKSSRNFLASLGSFAAYYIRFRDCWAWVWQVGRGTLGEALVTNPMGTNSLPKPLQLDVAFTPFQNSSNIFTHLFNLGSLI